MGTRLSNSPTMRASLSVYLVVTLVSIASASPAGVYRQDTGNAENKGDLSDLFPQIPTLPPITIPEIPGLPSFEDLCNVLVQIIPAALNATIDCSTLESQLKPAQLDTLKDAIEDLIPTLPANPATLPLAPIRDAEA